MSLMCQRKRKKRENAKDKGTKLISMVLRDNRILSRRDFSKISLRKHRRKSEFFFSWISFSNLNLERLEMALTPKKKHEKLKDFGKVGKKRETRMSK